MSNTSRIQQNNNQYTITIPAALVKALGLEKGVEMEWKVHNKETLLIRKRWNL